MKAIYLKKYDINFPDDRLIAASKRLWAKDIGGFTREEIDKGMEWIKTQKKNHEPGWEYLDVGMCVGAVKQANRVRAAHREFERLALPDKGAQERAKKAGASELAKLNAMFP